MSSLFQYRTAYANRDFAPPAVVAGEKILIQISGQQLITFVIALAYLKPIISESPIKLAVGSLTENKPNVPCSVYASPQSSMSDEAADPELL